MNHPASRTGFAWVRVNGADYGLYVLIETPDDPYLARNYDHPDGNLYDGKYRVWSDGSYTLLDFASGVDDLYELEAGDDAAHADVKAISDTLLANAYTPTFYDALAERIDWDEVHTHIAVEQWIGHLDGYTMNTNNYRVYFDPSDGRADFLPWDLDYAFLLDYQWGLSWYSPRGRITNACWSDATCTEAQRTAVTNFLATNEGYDWTGFLDRVEALTWDATEDDPRRECAVSDVQPSRDAIRAWIAAEPAAMRTWWGL